MALTEQTTHIDVDSNPFVALEVWDDGDGYMYHGLDFREGMEFHSEYFEGHENYDRMFLPSMIDSEECGYCGDCSHCSHCEDYGDWLTPRAEKLLARRVTELLPDNFVASTFCDTSDYPHIVISVTYNGDRELTDDNIESVYWPAHAVLANITDPGTFGAPYVFADVMRELSGE